MYTCPTCDGSGSAPNRSDDPCKTCFGRSVVLSLTSDCPTCLNRRAAPECKTCGDSGRVPVPIPFVSPVRDVPVEAISRALVILTTGGTNLDDHADAFVLGVTATLLKISSERRNQYAWDDGELFRSLDRGVVRLDVAGLWHFPDPSVPTGALLVRHPLN